MVDEYLAQRLKRIYDECQRAQDDDDEQNVGKTLIREFNELLSKFQEKYLENKIIQSIDPVDTSGVHGRAHPQDIQDIKLSTLKIADSLELDTGDFQQSSSDSINTIKIQQQQVVTQSVTVDNILTQVDDRGMSESDKEELKEVIREYQSEIESDDPDKSKLGELIDSARDKSPDIALKLGMAGLKRGIDLLI